MKVKEALILSLSNIKVHKLRSTLTTVGIILGVGAVIAMVTLGASFEAYFIDEFKGVFNPTVFTVAPGEVRTGMGIAGFLVPDIPIFTERDIKEIRNNEYVKSVYPFGKVQISPAGVKFGNRTLLAPMGSIEVMGGGGYEYFGSEGAVTLQSGRGFSNESEAVIGYGMAEMILKQENLTEISEVLGKIVAVRFSNGTMANFSIVGVTKSLYGYSPFDYTMFIDTSYYNEVRQVPEEGREEVVYYTVDVLVKSINDIKRAQDAVLNYLKTSSDAVKFLERDAPELDFIIISEEEVVKFIQNQIGQFGAFITSLGSISLLVGSVGIANMMLVSVRERTREIGVLKVFGARKRDILQLFLFEACLVGVMGSLIGVVVGIGLGYLFATYGFFGGVGLPITYKLEWIPTSVMIGVIVGIISGLYPAWRASKVNPVEALRYE